MVSMLSSGVENGREQTVRSAAFTSAFSSSETSAIVTVRRYLRLHLSYRQSTSTSIRALISTEPRRGAAWLRNRYSSCTMNR